MVFIAGLYVALTEKKSEVLLEQTEEVSPASAVEAKPETVSATTLSDVKTQQEPSITKTKEAKRIEGLIREGFVEDPNKALVFYKKMKDKNGKEILQLVDLNSPLDSFEPVERTVKEAKETLESKKDTFIADEFENLLRLDSRNENSTMLTGKFRDDKLDLEVRFAPLETMDGEPIDRDKVCFIFKKLDINVEHKAYPISIKADGTGYGVLRLPTGHYIRLVWSYEKVRALHGQIFKEINGQFEMLSEFTAEEIRHSRGEKLKYCD